MMVLALLATRTAFAQSGATGSIHAKDDAGQAMNIDFTASAQGASGGEGVLTFNGTGAVSDPDDESKPPAIVPLSLKVTVDCVVIDGNQAAISGMVRDSNVDAYRDKRVLLAVEDGGTTGPDKFTWGVYPVQLMKWIPADAEVPDDAGWKFIWYTSDAERPDDHGKPISRSTDVDCHSFPLTSFSFTDLSPNAGTVQVHP